MTESEYRKYEALLQSGALTQEEFEKQTAAYIPPAVYFRRRAPLAAGAALLTELSALLLRPDFEAAYSRMPYDDHPQFLVIAFSELVHRYLMPFFGVISLILLLAAWLSLRKSSAKQMRDNMTASLVLSILCIAASVFLRVQMLMPVS